MIGFIKNLKVGILTMKAIRSFSKGCKDNIDKCNAILKLNPNNYGALSMLAKHHVWLEEHDDALTYLNKILEQDAANLEALKLMVEIYYIKNDDHNVYEYINRIISNKIQDESYEIISNSFTLKVFSKFPKYKNADKKIIQYIEADKEETRLWNKWAQEFIAYYEQKYKNT